MTPSDRTAGRPRQDWLVGLALLALLALTLWLYWPGRTGPLLLDDVWNLRRLGERGGVTDLASFLQFVFDNDAGPSGRPVAMLSFLLDAQDWPPFVPALKYTNIMFHLLCGLALCWFSLLLAQALGMARQHAAQLALLVTALWLLHPLNLSTTLYIVQRMAQLMTLFSLLALVCYLKGRALMFSRPRLSLLCLGLCLFPFGLLAVLSKENGALLLGLILIMELVLFPGSERSRLFRYWLLGGVVLPLLVVLGYLLYSAPASLAQYELRHFNLFERLLTESRILLIYLWKVLLPNVIDSGLFHDDFPVSRHLLAPWTTLPAVLAVLGLLATSVLTARRQPLLSFALLWFFAMHFLESSYLPLELYFEHRNYLAMIGPLFALAWYLRRLLSDPATRHLAQSCSLLLGGVLLLMVWLTGTQARLWSDGNRLYGHWAEQQPGSIRAQLTYAENLNARGRPDLAMARIQQAREYYPNEVTVLLNQFNQACTYGLDQPLDLAGIAANPRLEYFRDDVTLHLRVLLENLFASRCPYPDRQTILALFERIGEFPLLGFRRANFHFYLSDLYIYYGMLDPALINLSRAFEHNPSPRIPIRQAIISASAGNFADALVFLQRAQQADEARNPLLPSDRAEIERLRADFQQRVQSGQ